MRRINFAYVGDGPDAYLAAYADWSARALILLGEPVENTQLAAEAAAELEPMTGSAERRRSRSLPPDHRLPPAADTRSAVVEPDDEESIAFPTNGPIDLWVTPIAVHENGLEFELRGREPYSRTKLSDRSSLNLGHRIGAGATTRVRLVVASPPDSEGTKGFVLANSFAQAAYPSDPTQPWLVGLSSSRSRPPGCEYVETRARYFLSPAPRRRPLYFMIAYPEFEIAAETVTASRAFFAQ